MITGDGPPLGFACVGLAPFRHMPEGADVILAELFVARLARYPGRWVLRASYDDARAIAFWRRTLPAAPLRGLEERRQGGDVVWRAVAGGMHASR